MDGAYNPVILTFHAVQGFHTIALFQVSNIKWQHARIGQNGLVLGSMKEMTLVAQTAAFREVYALPLLSCVQANDRLQLSIDLLTRSCG